MAKSYNWKKTVKKRNKHNFIMFSLNSFFFNSRKLMSLPY